MKTPKIIAAAALSLLAAAGAHAETYEGVHQVVSANSRADVLAQAFATAHAANQNVTNGSRVLASPVSSVDRATVRAEAVATAHAPNQNLDSKAFVNSVVPEQFTRARPVTQQAGL